MYVNGMGFHGIERVKGVHPTTLMTWVKPFCERLPNAYAPDQIPVVGELDELETFIGQKGENTRLRHYLARLHRKTLCYSKSAKMLAHSIRLLLHYLKFWDVPIPD